MRKVDDVELARDARDPTRLVDVCLETTAGDGPRALLLAVTIVRRLELEERAA